MTKPPDPMPCPACGSDDGGWDVSSCNSIEGVIFKCGACGFRSSEEFAKWYADHQHEKRPPEEE